MSEAPFAAPGSRNGGGYGWTPILTDDGRFLGYEFNIRTSGEDPGPDWSAHWHAPDEPVAPEPAPIIGGTVTWPVEGVGDEDREYCCTQFADHIARRRASHERRLATAAAYDDDDRNSYFPRALPDPVRDIGHAKPCGDSRMDHRRSLRIWGRLDAARVHLQRGARHIQHKLDHLLSRDGVSR